MRQSIDIGSSTRIRETGDPAWDRRASSLVLPQWASINSPGSALFQSVSLVPALNVVEVPVAGLGILLGIDRPRSDLFLLISVRAVVPSSSDADGSAPSSSRTGTTWGLFRAAVDVPPRCHGEVERGASPVVTRTYIRSRTQQESHDGKVAGSRRKVDGRIPVVVGGPRIGARLDQPNHHRKIRSPLGARKVFCYIEMPIIEQKQA